MAVLRTLFRRAVLALAGLLLLADAQEASAQVPPYVAEDFPAEEEGYYFLTTLNFGGGNNQSQLLILDGAGHVAYRRTVPNASNFRAWPDGRMSYATGGRNILLNSSFAIIDSVTCVDGVPTDLHDIRLLPNGHFLLLGIEDRIMDLSGYNLFPPGNAPGSTNATVKCAVIQELDADENLVWQWHLADHFDFLEVDPARLTNPNLVDWSHSNALELDDDGNILLSNRHFNSIVKVNRTSGEVMWSLGGVSNDFDFGSDPGFFAQHDIRRLPNGNITLFDNGLASGHPCRGVEYALDEAALTATPVWSRGYGGDAWSRAMGSMQRLANGNTLIGWGALWPDNATFTVYRQDSSRVCELRFADTLVTYRAYSFEELPFALNRPQITCIQQGGQYLLTAGAGWPVYLWSTGATGQSIVVNASDTVHVEVPAGPMAGWLRSGPFAVAVDCLTNEVADAARSELDVFPNPASTEVSIVRGAGKREDLFLTDALGRVVLRTRVSGARVRLSLEGVPAGVYLLKLDGCVRRLIKE